MTARAAFDLYQAGDLNGAMKAAAAVLNDNADDLEALFVAAQINMAGERPGLAYHGFMRIVEADPTNANAWNNAGHALHRLQRYREAAKCFVKALETGGDRFAPWNNLILMVQNLGDTERAKDYFRMALWHAENAQDRQDCTGNVSLSLLATRHWATGWDAYEHLIRPNKLREEVKYEPDLPVWDGSPGGEVVIYGEQGIGDELLFASSLPDTMSRVSVIVDCDPRLTSLFKRSFNCVAYGTRFNKPQHKTWLKDHSPKAKIAIGSLAKFYRCSESDFPRRPYLVPDPEKRAMARALLDQWPGRKIGLAWTGGKKHTRAEDRSLTLEQLEPILTIPGCTFVSLQYNGDYYASPDQRIKHVPIFTQSKDYDDTAALVAELDGVVSVTTAVALLAGAVGTPAHVLIPQFPTWHWPRTGEFPWFPLTLHRRQGPAWQPCIAELADAISGETWANDTLKEAAQ